MSAPTISQSVERLRLLTTCGQLGEQRDLARNLAARLEAENHEMLQALRAAQHMFDHSITGAAYQIIREAVATFGGQE